MDANRPPAGNGGTAASGEQRGSGGNSIQLVAPPGGEARAAAAGAVVLVEVPVVEEEEQQMVLENQMVEADSAENQLNPVEDQVAAAGAEENQMAAAGNQMIAAGAEENQMAAAGAEENQMAAAGADENQMAAAGAVDDQGMVDGLDGRLGAFQFNPDDFPALARGDNPEYDSGDDESDSNPEDEAVEDALDNLEDEAVDDALDNLDDDDEDGMEEDEVENGVAFVHVFSPRQQLDSDHESESEDEADDQRVEHFDVNLPGQHLYIPDDEDHSAELPADPPAPLLPPLLAPHNQAPPEPPPQQEQQPASSGLNALRIFDDLPPVSGAFPAVGFSTHCPPLPVETIRLPVLEHTRQHNSLMVLPGMKVPLMISTPRDRAVIAAARRTPQRAFVSLNLRQTGPVYACTLQVVQAREGLGNLHIIARATQRFRLHATHREVSGVVVAEIECLPEVLVTAPLSSVRHVSHDRHQDPTSRQLLLLKHRSHSAHKGSLSSPLDSLYPDAEAFSCSCGVDTQDKQRHRDRHRDSLMRKRRLCSRYTSVLTQVPPWVLQELDVYRLAAAVRKYLLVLGSEGVRIPESPVSVCEYACLNMPLPDAHRRQLLQLSCCHQKLLYLLNLQEKWHSLVCTQCHAVITKRTDLIIVSSEGQQSAFVNPRGFVHEIITVRYTDRLYLMGVATAEHSWFPGYSWTIASCSGCRQHVGWKFTANRANLRPKKFYGLTRGGVMPM